ncbi:hypothetical protein AB0D62_36360 [Streptomyces massasporeus]|uniref:hypothetical protein n=1 Tax=Streptomyces massasporeus TaxID=67324 RepID=UPI0033C52CA6
MNIRWGGSVWELMPVKRAVGTALSNSASGGYSTLLRDGARNLVGHADLLNGKRAVAGLVAVSAVAGGALTAATMKATPHLKTKFRSVAQDTAEGAAEAASDPVEEPDTIQGPRLRAV